MTDGMHPRDEDVAAAAMAALRGDPHLRAADIQLEVEDGWVTVTSGLTSETERYAARRALRHLRGVRGVSITVPHRPERPASRPWLRLVGIVLVVVLAACRAGPKPVIALQGSVDDFARAAGNWSGDYGGTGPGGMLTVSLAVAHDSAFGDLIMLPTGEYPPVAAHADAEHRTHVQLPQALRITFVRMDGRRMGGTLEAYRAPDCDCVRLTTFEGVLRADTIAGTWRTREERGGSVREGWWRVVRQR